MNFDQSFCTVTRAGIDSSYFKAMALARPVYIVAAKRTAFGAFGGKLKNVTATGLGEYAAVAALAAAKVDPAIVDAVIFGNVIQVCLA